VAQSARRLANAVWQRQPRWPPRSAKRRCPGSGATLRASVWIVSLGQGAMRLPDASTATCLILPQSKVVSAAKRLGCGFHTTSMRCGRAASPGSMAAPSVSSVRTKPGHLAFQSRRTPVLFPYFLGVGVPQSNGAIEHRPTGLRVRIGTKITLSLELDGFRRIALGQHRLNTCVRQNLKRVRIEIGCEMFSAFWIRPREQRIVKSQFRRQKTVWRNTNDGYLDLATIRSVASSRCRIIGAAQLRYLTLRIFHRFTTRNEIGVA